VGAFTLKGSAVKSLHTVTCTWPAEGSAAFVRAAALLSQGTFGAAPRPTFCAAIRRANLNGGLFNPGEGTT